MTFQMRSGILLAASLLAAGGAAGQAYDPSEREPGRPRRPRDEAAAGLFFTPRLIDLAINRMTEEMARHYEFDEDQLWATRELWKERFPGWLEKNRGEIITLVNQYMEAVLGEDPPTPEQVADWSQRALPLLNEFTGMVEQTADEMRGYMTDEQQTMLDGEMAAFRVATGYMTQRMRVWSEGGYDWRTEWPRSEEFDRSEAERQRAVHDEAERARAEAAGTPPAAAGGPGAGAAEPGAARPAEPKTAATPGAGPKDEWTIYVDNFVKRYQLDDVQKELAYRILRRHQEQRDAYLRRKLAAIKNLEQRMQAARTDEEKSRLREEYAELNRPVERIFEQLKDKLDPLPTRAQRAAAARAEMTARATAEKRPTASRTAEQPPVPE